MPRGRGYGRRGRRSFARSRGRRFGRRGRRMRRLRSRVGTVM